MDHYRNSHKYLDLHALQYDPKADPSKLFFNATILSIYNWITYILCIKKPQTQISIDAIVYVECYRCMSK